MIKGEDIHSLKKSVLYSWLMYVPQNPEHMFIADIVGEELSFSNKTVDSAERFGLSEKMDSNVFRLSEGEKRRVNLSAAFASGRSLYLLDEPTYGLDFEAKEILSSDIRALTREGAAVLFVTHERVFAENTADILYVMKKDGLVQEEHHEYARLQA